MNIINYDTLNNSKLLFNNSNIYNNKTTIKCYINNHDNIILKTPKSELQSNINSGFLVTNILHNTKNNVFINIIKKKETETGFYIKNTLKKKNIKLYSNIIEDIKNNNNTKCIFKIKDLKNLKIFNKDNENIENNTLEIYSNIILLIKLQNIWVNFETKKYGLNWHIYQIKTYPEINLNKCIIFDSDDEDDNDVIKKHIIIQKCVFCNTTCSYNNTFNNIRIGKGGSNNGKGGINTKGIKGGKGNGTNINDTGRGSGNITSTKLNINKTDSKKQSNKSSQLILKPPTANQLIDIKNKLKKVNKINSDSD